MASIRTLMLAVIAAAALGGCAQPGHRSTAGGLPPVAEVGSFHVGGEQVTLSGLPTSEMVFSPGSPPVKLDPNGDFMAGQMYARYTRLQHPQAPVPMLLWHGGGLAGTTYETKPDGQPGWEMFFLKAGWDVYVSDAVERGRASWARYPEIYQGEPVFRTKKEAWELFRFGRSYASDPAQRQALPGTQFPVQAFDQFTKQSIPRWATNDARTQQAYDQYVEQVCPCVIVVHSQGGNFALNAALRHPGKIKAMVLVEPSGTPDPGKTDLRALAGTPMLWVWGDYLEQYPFWQRIRERQETFRQALLRAGGRGEVLDLPAEGVRGNSHMLMMDRNSDDIAARIQAWLRTVALR